MIVFRRTIINIIMPTLLILKEKIEGSKDEYKYKLELFIGGNGDEISIGKPIISNDEIKQMLKQPKFNVCYRYIC